MPYPPFTTTVIGSYSVPRWFEFLAALVEDGKLSAPELADAQFRATQAAIADQRTAGIDVITGGEMHRRRSNRHAPLNAMLNYFWARMPGFQKDASATDGLATRPMPIARSDPGVTHPAAICIDAITDDADLGLAEEFTLVSRYADQPVKVTVTGPYTLSKFTWNEYYPDSRTMMTDIAQLLNRNLLRLTEAGCTDIQMDEPLLAGTKSEEAADAVEAINLALEDLPATVHRSLHACQGNYSVGIHYDGQLGQRYFAGDTYNAVYLAAVSCDALLIEGDMAAHFEGRLGDRQLGVGAVDVQDVAVETGEVLAERVAQLSWLPPEQMILTTSCGLNHLPRHIAFGKLAALADAKQILCRQ